jgi:hypothetical protein
VQNVVANKDENEEQQVQNEAENVEQEAQNAEENEDENEEQEVQNAAVKPNKCMRSCIGCFIVVYNAMFSSKIGNTKE